MLHKTLRNKILISILTCLITSVSFAQYSKNTPYSRYGIGDLRHSGFAENRAVGGLAVGLRQKNLLNYINPASYTSQNPKSFIFDIGINGNYTASLQKEMDMYENADFNIHHLAIGFPITSWLKSSVGVVPYSSVSYTINEPVNYNDIGEVKYYYEGSGGINKFYIGNAVELFNKLSLGFNFSYLFGSISQETHIYFPDDEKEYFNSHINNKTSIGDMRLNYGIQYSDSIFNDFSYTIGAVFNQEANLNIENDHFSFYTPQITETNDTISHNQGITDQLLIPAHIGLGISGTYKDKLTIGVDYHQQDWTDTDFRNINGNNLTEQNEWHLGLEYVPDRRSITSYFDRIRYRVGGYYKNTYLSINGNQIQDKALTLGLGLPFGNTNTSLNLAFELGQRGTTKNSLIEENYINLLFNITLYDFWFFKRKFD